MWSPTAPCGSAADRHTDRRQAMARWFRSQRSFARYCALTAIATPACWSRAAGIPVHVMAARLGHADPAVTSRIYSHVLREHTLGVGEFFAQAVK